MKLAYYYAPIVKFLSDTPATILGELAAANTFSLDELQRDAWLEQIEIVKAAAQTFPRCYVFFEFTIPRMGKRADVVIVFDCSIAVVEFKVGSSTFDRHAIEQVHDYALDLKNFHRGSHKLPIIPVLVATRAAFAALKPIILADDGVAEPISIGGDQLELILAQISAMKGGPAINLDAWMQSGYQPTPTIIEAAQALYQAHGVAEIARSDAGAINLSRTSDCISQIIERSKGANRKSICLVTGVPGAGKTLAGLNIATRRGREHSDEHAVFLSGNGPLVDVLREALARDDVAREKKTKTLALRKVGSFIQNIHHFRDEALRDPKPPYEKVAVFDEAQRAWNREQASKFMEKKRGVKDFGMSEPEFLIGVMDRHNDWCVIIALIGGGQEINTGEAGLSEWITALQQKFSHWDVYISNRLADLDYVGDASTVESLKQLSVQERADLHLAVSLRSFRAETLSTFVGHVVDHDPDRAKEVYATIAHRYPIWITRNLDDARRWLRSQARGSERYGLLASAEGRRLRAEGLNVMAKIDAPTWFLNDRTDVRSSFYCEEVATEFDVQGLELDWAGVCWDADLRAQENRWGRFRFRGTSWQHIHTPQGQNYLKNAYRVLLTRARQGVVIYVPLGSADDPTRLPVFFNHTFEFLKSCGLHELLPIGHS